MTPEEFRQFGHQVIDWIADYRASVGDRPVMSQVTPGAVKSKIPNTPPKQGEPFAEILQDVDDVILPGLTHWNHPDYYAYFPSNAMLASVLGDLLSSGFGTLGLNWQSSPALTEVEEVAADWVRQMLGLSDAWHGVIQDTASTASLVALLCAREWTTNHSQTAGGMQAEDAPLVVYSSAESHSSVKKAALLAGYGLNTVRSIETDEQNALSVTALRAAIEADIAAGLKPSAVIATTGTTSTTALDPIDEIAALADAFGLWLHVDAAMAGTAMLCPENRWMWDGVERAHSMVLNPHKWMGTVFDLSLFYTRHPEHLIRVMSTNPSYLQTAADGEAINYRDWGIPLGRRFRAMKLWFLIREQGVDGLQARIRRDIGNAKWLAETLEADPEWEVLMPVPLQTVCVRHTPAGNSLTSEELDRHTQAWADQINRSGKAYVTPSKLNGRWMVRLSIGAEPTERADVERLWETLQDAVQAA